MTGAWPKQPWPGVLLAFLAFVLPVSAAHAERRVALVIGNAAYQNAPALAAPAKDASAMAAMFRKAGYDVVSTASNLGIAQFRSAVRQFDDAAADSDVAVVYYSGHGIQIKGTNYLIPVDAKLASDWDAEDQLVALDRLFDAVAQARRLGLIVLDASRENPFTKTIKQQRPKSPPVAAGVAATESANVNVVIAYAAKAGTLAANDVGDHSAYTTALMHSLFVPGLDVRLAFGRVRDEVLKATDNRQEPFLYGSLGGANIALVPGPEKTAAIADDLNDVRADYRLVEKINNKGAWQIFLTQHPTGCYADLARARVAALEGVAKESAAAAEKPAAAADCDK
jgi:uncharacterized caspase-like protein